MMYFLFLTLFNQVASSFRKKVANLYEQSNRRVSPAVRAYWNPWWHIKSFWENLSRVSLDVVETNCQVMC